MRVGHGWSRELSSQPSNPDIKIPGIPTGTRKRVRKRGFVPTSTVKRRE
jgi:hypothetical protein